MEIGDNESSISDVFAIPLAPTYYKHEITDKFDGTVTVLFEACGYSPPNKVLHAELYDLAGAPVAGSEVTVQATAPTRTSRATVTLTEGHEYCVRYKSSKSGKEVILVGAKLIFQQVKATNILKTRVFHRISNARRNNVTSCGSGSRNYGQYKFVSANYSGLSGRVFTTIRHEAGLPYVAYASIFRVTLGNCDSSSVSTWSTSFVLLDFAPDLSIADQEIDATLWSSTSSFYSRMGEMRLIFDLDFTPIEAEGILVQIL